MSGAEESTYDALTQVCKEKLLPPRCECSKSQRPTGIHFWRDHGKSFLQAENETDYIFILKAKIQRIEKSRTSQQKNTTVPKDLILEIWSDLGLRDIYHDLSEKRIQYLLKHNDAYIRRNTRFSNKSVLRPIRAKEVQIRNQIDMMDIAVKGQSLLKVNNIDKSWPLSMFSMTLYGFVQWKTNLVKRTIKELYHEHASIFALQCEHGTEFRCPP